MTRPIKNYYVSSWYKLLRIFPLVQGRGSTNKEGEILCAKNKYEASATYQAHWNILLHSYTCLPEVFVRYLPKWSKPRYLKVDALQEPQNVRTVLVWYLLPGIRNLVYSCTGCGTSKMYLCLEDNRSSFSRVSLKSKTKDARP